MVRQRVAGRIGGSRLGTEHGSQPVSFRLVDVRVLIIGYSFSDPHINKVLFDAAVNKGTELFIVDPMATIPLRERLQLEGKKHGSLDPWCGAYHLQGTFDEFLQFGNPDWAEYMEAFTALKHS